ncbi:MAG: aminotransferase class III-fold pyridoxal phosphate-dependent enzyme, partial [Pseudonocardiaceae bacterium]
KSISGYGLPMALTLIRPELDVWAPGEHNGTFRGNNAAFVTAAHALEKFWTDDTLQRSTLDKGERINRALDGIADGREGISVRGRGMAKGLAFEQAEQAAKVCTAAFDRGLLMETAGPSDEVAKMLPALTISYDELDQGLDILGEAVAEVHD